MLFPAAPRTNPVLMIERYGNPDRIAPIVRRILPTHIKVDFYQEFGNQIRIMEISTEVPVKWLVRVRIASVERPCS